VPDLATAPGAQARARYVRVSPMKARRVVDLIRGMSANDALDVLAFAPQAASEPVRKVLASAVANAEHNERLDADVLVVDEAYVDEGPTMKRFRPRAQGRAFRIRKRTSHITIIVRTLPASEQSTSRGRKATGGPAKKATASKATASTATAAKATKKAAPAKAAPATASTDSDSTTGDDTASNDGKAS